MLIQKWHLQKDRKYIACFYTNWIELLEEGREHSSSFVYFSPKCYICRCHQTIGATKVKFLPHYSGSLILKYSLFENNSPFNNKHFLFSSSILIVLCSNKKLVNLCWKMVSGSLWKKKENQKLFHDCLLFKNSFSR